MLCVYGRGNVKLDKDTLHMALKSTRMAYKESDVSRIPYNP